MRVGEEPRWHVRSRSSDGGVVACGALEATFVGGLDLEVGEAVFVSLRGLNEVRAVWPAVAHLPSVEGGSQPTHGALASLCREVPWAFDALVLDAEPAGLVAYELQPNEYALGGVDFTVEGELCLEGCRLPAPLVPGPIGTRPGTAGEHQWLVSHGLAREGEPVLVIATAARINAPGGDPRACIGGTPRWVRHSHDSTQHLDEALRHLDLAEGPRFSVEGTAVVASSSTQRVVLGHADQRAALRWITVANAALQP